MLFKPPIIQIALDYPTIDEALSMAEIGVRAGVDWLEAGTPLIVAQGAGTIGKLKRALPLLPRPRRLQNHGFRREEQCDHQTAGG